MTQNPPRRSNGRAHILVLGWREWVSLPTLGIDWVKAKIDTGARTSSIHAHDLELFVRDDTNWARFVVHPWQRSGRDAREVELPLLDQRHVMPSNGSGEVRPVVALPVRIGSRTTTIELTLTRRDSMGFRMLIGRQALRGTFVVDPGLSYAGGRPPGEIRKKNRARATGAAQ